MPAVETNWIAPNKVGVTNAQDIKNVQNSAKAIIDDVSEISYKVLKFGSEFEPYSKFVDDIRNAFIDFVSTLEDKNLTKLVDTVYEGFYSEAMDKVCEKACTLLYEGSLFSDTLKEHLVKKYPELSLDMLSKPKSTDKKSGKVKEVIDTESLDIDIDSL